jgi:hypothetical protein
MGGILLGLKNTKNEIKISLHYHNILFFLVYYNIN